MENLLNGSLKQPENLADRWPLIYNKSSLARLDNFEMNWRLAEAKNKFSELVNKALEEGPQHVQRRQDTVVVIALHDYQQLTRQKVRFKEFLLGNGPDLDGIAERA